MAALLGGAAGGHAELPDEKVEMVAELSGLGVLVHQPKPSEEAESEGIETLVEDGACPPHERNRKGER